MPPLHKYLKCRPRYGISAPAVEWSATLPTYIRITDVDHHGRFRPAPAVSVASPAVANYFLEDGDLVIARTGASVGKFYRYRPSDGPLVFAGFLIAVKPDPEILDPGYLACLFQSKHYWDWIAAESIRSGQPGINAQQLSQFEIKPPDIEDQRAIAKIIQVADDFHELLERLIHKKRAINRGLMQQLLTGRSRLPNFSDDWPIIELGDHVSYVHTVALSREQLNLESPLRYLHYGDIHKSKSVRLDAASENMPRADSDLASLAGRLMPGDLIFADASEDPDGVGKSVEILGVPPEGVVSGLHTIAARFDISVLADGFKAYLQFIPEFRAALLRLAAGTKVLATTRSSISSISLALPGTDEQRAIVKVLKHADAEIDALERLLQMARNVKVGMMQELLTGRIPLQLTEEA